MKKRSVIVAAVQTTVSTDQAKNLKKTVRKVEVAAKRGAKIICLQELCKTIYFPQYKKRRFDDYAETIPGESTRAFAAIAKRYKAFIIVPVFEKTARGQYYNSAAVLNPTGKLLPTYHKIHIPQDPLFYEKNYFKEGQSGYKIYKTPYGNIAVLICYDQWFPEAARMATLAGADIIFYPTAIGTIVNYTAEEGDWHDAWETIQRAHAIANSVYVVAVNRVGREDRLRFWGQSFICDNFGKILRRASANKEETILVKVDFSRNRYIRSSWGFFHNRRKDTYRLH
ncbi:MAG: hypothetical protein ACD_41C00369G0004 [uncultured bacterium]|nr:MAG: hypothetical protein ACD_41C00369G0004 [uncultured bacterium]HBY74158.1 acyltransferase [Candidatus Kerfeldbacteria bacterium]